MWSAVTVNEAIDSHFLLFIAFSSRSRTPGFSPYLVNFILSVYAILSSGPPRWLKQLENTVHENSAQVSQHRVAEREIRRSEANTRQFWVHWVFEIPGQRCVVSLSPLFKQNNLTLVLLLALCSDMQQLANPTFGIFTMRTECMQRGWDYPNP